MKMNKIWLTFLLYFQNLSEQFCDFEAKMFYLISISVIRRKSPCFHTGFSFFTYSFLFNSQTQPQAQLQDEEITEDDLRLIQERESSIRQLEVSFKLQN